ncbi:MAG: small multi-drug export protein [Nanoarchaeota archaeon]|nr:small multi-drug export protein [Nanoarchaeota archaeon]
MDSQLLIGLLLTVLPVFELRGGLPVVVEYALKNGVSVWPYFFIVLILNVLVIFFIFIFFDFAHEVLMRVRWYRVVAERALKRLQRKADKLERKMAGWGYFALMFFVAIPLPGTGAWTGTIVAWILGLDRVKSFLAIASGVVVAGLLILLFSLGIFG